MDNGEVRLMTYLSHGDIGKRSSKHPFHPWRLYPCKDGYVFWSWWGGARAAQRNPPLIQWMEEEGMLNDYLRNFDWLNFDYTVTSQEVIDNISKPILEFFAKHTKEELFLSAIKRRLMLYPVSTVEDISNSAQLASRDYWVELEHPELDTKIKYPGAFTKSTLLPPQLRCRAPLIGEHNEEVYNSELGISREALVMLKQDGVV